MKDLFFLENRSTTRQDFNGREIKQRNFLFWVASKGIQLTTKRVESNKRGLEKKNFRPIPMIQVPTTFQIQRIVGHLAFKR